MTLDEVIDAIKLKRAGINPTMRREDDFTEAFNVGLDVGLEWVLILLDKVDLTPPTQNWDQP